MQSYRSNFRMEDEYITMIRGDTVSFGLQITGVTSLDSAFFTVKESYGDTNFVFQKYLNHGISLIEDGKYAVRIAPEDTAEIEAKKYVYDLQLGVGQDIYTVLRGVLDVLPDVTRGED